MSVSYELEIRLDPSIREAYLDWLPGHVEEVLKSPGFESAEIFEDDEEVFHVRYRVRSEDLLESYFVNRAPALRAETERLFGGRFETRRRVLECRVRYGAISG